MSQTEFDRLRPGLSRREVRAITSARGAVVARWDKDRRRNHRALYASDARESSVEIDFHKRGGAPWRTSAIRWIPAADAEGTVSRAEFARLKPGLTHRQVYAVTAAAGVLSSSTTQGNYLVRNYRYSTDVAGASVAIRYRNLAGEPWKVGAVTWVPASGSPTPPPVPPTPPAPPTPPTPPAPGEPPVPSGGHGGTNGWRIVQDVDLTREPTGTAYTTGVRNTDQSYNRRDNAVWDSRGLTVTATRETEGARIYSADVQMRGVRMPDTFALEADVTLVGLGSGMFPSLWARPSGEGQGELDFFEYCGSQIGKKLEMKSTMIRTGSLGSGYNLGQAMVGLPKAAFGNRFDGRHLWRFEKTAQALTIWVDGRLVDQITKAAYESDAGAGQWDALADNWYPRVTFQVGDGAGAKLGGPIPPAWRTSTMTVSALRVYGR
ncbi:LamG domain-containing protein [Nocardioides dongxiaopingii]|uniref:family 16 glycosylhydrolase n=1 Tax=Nocardioides sp. S-1144 TaxID=2582905 RepID=UPI0016526113|nr:family 16 glycosylhydrolase [Nocardioides sp. S-1144]